MIFPKRQDFISLAGMSGLALGTTSRTEITREFHLECLFIAVSVTVSTAAATANPDAILNILKKVQISVSDGSRTRNVIDASGPALLEYHAQIMGNLDRGTLTAVGGNSTTTYTIRYPVWFAHPQLTDPEGSALLLPMYRYTSNPVLTLQWATQADMDVNATPTFAVSALSFSIVTNRREVLIPKWPAIDFDLIENETALPTSGDVAVDLPIPGSFTGILLRGYTSASARGDVLSATGSWSLEQQGIIFRRARSLDIQTENDWSKAAAAAGLFTGSFYLDFLTDKAGVDASELGSVLDGNIPAESGVKIQLKGNVTGGTNVRLKQLYHRIQGKISDLKLVA